MSAISIQTLGVCVSLDRLTYLVRPERAAGGGRLFHSFEIAKAYAREQYGRTGQKQRITERMSA